MPAGSLATAFGTITTESYLNFVSPYDLQTQQAMGGMFSGSASIATATLTAGTGATAVWQDTVNTYASGVWTCVCAGKYTVTVEAHDNSTGNAVAAYLYYNGSQLHFAETSSGGAAASASATWAQNVAIGDTFEVYIKQLSGSTQTVAYSLSLTWQGA